MDRLGFWGLSLSHAHAHAPLILVWLRTRKATSTVARIAGKCSSGVSGAVACRRRSCCLLPAGVFSATGFGMNLVGSGPLLPLPPLPPLRLSRCYGVSESDLHSPLSNAIAKWMDSDSDSHSPFLSFPFLSFPFLVNTLYLFYSILFFFLFIRIRYHLRTFSKLELGP